MMKRWLQRWHRPLSLEQQWQKIEIQATWSNALIHYLSQPVGVARTPLKSVKLLALDFETTGVDASEDQILSIGMVDLSLDGIDIASSEEIYIDHGQFIKPETARINGLMPKDLAEGISLSAGMDRLLERATGKVILAHGSCIEKAFIQAYFARKYQIPSLPVYMIDTLGIEKQFSYAGKTGAHHSYQLDDLRHHYQLPSYLSHSAASDALACAELLLVQSKKLDALQHCVLSQLCQ